MHRIVIDTNVYISGTFWTGSPKQLLIMASRKQFITLVSQGILDEIIDILTREDKPFRLSIEEAKRVVHKILEYAVMVTPIQRFTVCKDEKDNMVLECAINGKADFIVTGDSDLLALKKYEGMQIVTVRKMFEILSPSKGER